MQRGVSIVATVGVLLGTASAAFADGMPEDERPPPRKRTAATSTTEAPKPESETDKQSDAPAPPKAAPPRFRYAAMTRDECEAELTTRGITFQRETAKGVLAPVRLTGRLHGVKFRTNGSKDGDEGTIWDIADCRLVLSLDDFSEVLAAHDIVEVRHYSMYRRAPKRWPDDKIGTRHNGGLALDAATFIKSDGSKLDVLDDFKGKRYRKVCGKDAPKGKTEAARELRELVCSALDIGMFSVILTPNFNRAHRNHFHLELTPGVKWLWLR